MRITVAVVLLLLFSAENARGQTVAATPALASSVQAPPSALPSSQPVATPMTPVFSQPAAELPTTARAPVATTSALAAVQESPRKRSRVLWILVGVVAVLTIIVVAR